MAHKLAMNKQTVGAAAWPERKANKQIDKSIEQAREQVVVVVRSSLCCAQPNSFHASRAALSAQAARPAATGHWKGN